MEPFFCAFSSFWNCFFFSEFSISLCITISFFAASDTARNARERVAASCIVKFPLFCVCRFSSLSFSNSMLSLIFFSPFSFFSSPFSVNALASDLFLRKVFPTSMSFCALFFCFFGIGLCKYACTISMMVGLSTPISSSFCIAFSSC